MEFPPGFSGTCFGNSEGYFASHLNAGDGIRSAMPIIIGDYAITVVSCLFLPIIGANVFLKVMAAQTVADIFIDHHFVMQT